MNQKPLPTTKEELIAVLQEQLEKVQDDINSMQSTLEEERATRKNLTVELQEKERKVEELIQNEAKTLGDKVNQSLYKTLQAANRIRADAETETRRFMEENTILNEKITHKDNEVFDKRALTKLNAKKLAVMEHKRIDWQRKKHGLRDKKQLVETNLQMTKKELEHVQREQNELRTHIENLKKLRMYLNKNLQVSNKASYNSVLPSKNGPEDGNFWN